MVVIINVLNMSIIAECSTCITALHNRIIITEVHVFLSTAVHVVLVLQYMLFQYCCTCFYKYCSTCCYKNCSTCWYHYCSTYCYKYCSTCCQLYCSPTQYWRPVPGGGAESGPGPQSESVLVLSWTPQHTLTWHRSNMAEEDTDWSYSETIPKQTISTLSRCHVCSKTLKSDQSVPHSCWSSYWSAKWFKMMWSSLQSCQVDPDKKKEHTKSSLNLTHRKNNFILICRTDSLCFENSRDWFCNDQSYTLCFYKVLPTSLLMHSVSYKLSGRWTIFS